MIPRILVLDDNAMTLEITKDALENEGFVVDTALTLGEFESLRDARPSPDLFLVDVQMPEMEGDEVVSLLRRKHEVAVPILLVSSLPDGDLEQRTSTSLATGFVSKAAGVDALVAMVRHLMADYEPHES
ncbi:MAG: response regulator [Polyangiaceae bacterium]